MRMELNGSDYNGHNLRRHKIVSIKPTTLARVSGWNILSRILGYFACDKY